MQGVLGGVLAGARDSVGVTVRDTGEYGTCCGLIRIEGHERLPSLDKWL